MALNENAQEDQSKDINGLSSIKSLASQFLEAIKPWENSAEEITKEKMAGERVAGENKHMQSQNPNRLLNWVARVIFLKKKL